MAAYIYLAGIAIGSYLGTCNDPFTPFIMFGHQKRDQLENDFKSEYVDS